MLTKAQFSILPNRSQAQKEAKTRTFSHGNYNQILEAYLHVPTWGDSPSFQRLRVTRSKPVVPGEGGRARPSYQEKRQRQEPTQTGGSHSLECFRVCGLFCGTITHVVLLDTPAVFITHRGGGCDKLPLPP